MADDFAGHLVNQTNLAIKGSGTSTIMYHSINSLLDVVLIGIVGIRASAEIASLLGDDTKAENYTVSFFNEPYLLKGSHLKQLIQYIELCE